MELDGGNAGDQEKAWKLQSGVETRGLKGKTALDLQNFFFHLTPKAAISAPSFVPHLIIFFSFAILSEPFVTSSFDPLVLVLHCN